MVSQRQFGLSERGRRKVGSAFGSSLYSLWLARGAWTEVRGRRTHVASLAFKVEDCTQTYAVEAGGSHMQAIQGC